MERKCFWGLKLFGLFVGVMFSIQVQANSTTFNVSLGDVDISNKTAKVKTAKVRIKNVGKRPASGIQFNIPTGAPITIIDNQCSGRELARDVGQCEVTVRVDPVTVGDLTNTISITFNNGKGSDQATKSISVTGRATCPPTGFWGTTCESITCLHGTPNMTNGKCSACDAGYVGPDTNCVSCDDTNGYAMNASNVCELVPADLQIELVL